MEGKSGYYCHVCVWPDLKPATVRPLPITAATRKRMIPFHPMVRSCVLRVCGEDSGFMVLLGVDTPIFTTIDSHDLHIHEQGTKTKRKKKKKSLPPSSRVKAGAG